MKMRITKEEISTLEESQRIRLNEVWTPDVYDLVMATICTDVDQDIYEKVEFVIGQIQVSKNGSVLLHDLRYVPSTSDESPDDPMASDPTATSNTSPILGQVEILEASLKAPFVDSEEDESDDFEEYEDFQMDAPTSFSKEDCLPLLNIGQMINILSKFNFGSGDFYLTAAIGEIGCDVGKNDNSWNDHYENAELCDVLWESLKAIL